MRMTKSDQTVQERNGVTRCLFLANRDHSCTVSRHLECSCQLGCTLEPPTSGPQYCPLHLRTCTLTENLLQTFRSTVQSTSAILTSVKPGNCSLARFSQVGAKFLQWPHLGTKEGDLFSRYTFPLYLYCLAAIAVSLASGLSYPLMIWPSNSLALLCQ